MDVTIALAILGAAAAGFVQGLSGSFFAMVALAVWVWVLPPQLAGPMAVFGSLIGQLIAVRVLLVGFNMRRVLPFLVGGTLGVPLGVWLLPHVDHILFKAGLGVFLMIWCPIMLLSPNLPPLRHGGRWADAAMAWIGGVMGGLGGLAGAVPTLWCVLRRWDRDAQRAVFQSFNLTMHVVTIAIYGATGLIDADVGWMFLLITLPVLAAVVLGLWLYARISEAAFRRIVLMLLSAAGVALVGASVPRLI